MLEGREGRKGVVESAGWVGHAAAGAQASYKSRDGEMRERQPRENEEL